MLRVGTYCKLNEEHFVLVQAPSSMSYIPSVDEMRQYAITLGENFDEMGVPFKVQIREAVERLHQLRIAGPYRGTVEQILRAADSECVIDVHVIHRMMRRYAAAVNNALLTDDTKLLRTVYDEAASLPYTQTAKELSANCTGYVLDRLLINGNDSLNICFKSGVPHVLKVSTAVEYHRAKAWEEAVRRREDAERGKGAVVNADSEPVDWSLSPYITRFEAVQVERKGGSKYFIFMPLCPTTLESLPVMDATVLQRFYSHTSKALKCFHQLGFVHMDVKPSNILVSGNGDFILADLGSLVPVGSKSDSTPAYLPREMWNRGTNRGPLASVVVDWWMLAATMCEKACGYQAGQGTENATKGDIVAMLTVLGGETEDNRILVDDLLAHLSNE